MRGGDSTRCLGDRAETTVTSNSSRESTPPHPRRRLHSRDVHEPEELGRLGRVLRGQGLPLPRPGLARTSSGPDGAIDFAKPHAPLLLVGGERDHIIPCELNEKNFKAYKDPGSVRAFKVFAGRDHFLCGSPGWEEIATFVHEWLQAHAKV